jgi:hypothetical protein
LVVLVERLTNCCAFVPPAGVACCTADRRTWLSPQGSDWNQSASAPGPFCVKWVTVAARTGELTIPKLVKIATAASQFVMHALVLMTIFSHIEPMLSCG